MCQIPRDYFGYEKYVLFSFKKSENYYNKLSDLCRFICLFEQFLNVHQQVNGFCSGQWKDKQTVCTHQFAVQAFVKKIFLSLLTRQKKYDII